MLIVRKGRDADRRGGVIVKSNANKLLQDKDDANTPS